jgi:hypothetical protein
MRAAGIAGSGSARCRPRRSSWCRYPPSSAPRRLPGGPGAHTTGWRLRRQETGRISAPHTHQVSLPPPPPSSRPRTLASLTAAASLGHLHPAVGAGEHLTLLEVTLHVAPLRADIIVVGISCRACILGLTLLGVSWTESRLQRLLPALSSQKHRHQDTSCSPQRSLPLKEPVLAGRCGTLLPLSVCKAPSQLLPSDYVAGAGDASVAGVLPAFSICHSTAISFHHTF